MGYRGKGEVPDDEQQAVYRRVIQEMGYKAAIAVPSFGRSGPGDGLAYVEIEGFRYSLNQKRLVAIRESVHDGAAYFELFDVRQGGLRPRLRTRAGGC
jgi:hypothetical protein